MAKAESSKSSVSSFTSEHEENNYYELLDAFNELHKEATKLQKSNSKRKGEIKWLEGRIKQLEEENENLITCLEKLEKSEKHPRSRSKLKKAEIVDESNDDYNSDSEALRLMVKGFSKFIKYKNKATSNSAEIKRSSRKQEKHVPTCYECGKMGHIKPECPVLKLKQKLEEKGETDKHKKKRKAYNSDSSSSSESDGSIEEETNLCLMAGTSSSKSSAGLS
ncbi:uncharacterized protein LOC114184724 [Vigna unguiculata]|uniref:uncharacterized protein LOC114184724 n=1 Tax=Vigna unguiculata TaxID=3917 RepID=UPI001016C3A6|nr:uncharacterized protein LOC114184724 [Vigna unguiculata]